MKKQEKKSDTAFHELRKEYRARPLGRNDLKKDPFDQFHRWFDEAIREDIMEPNAFSLATATLEGLPSCRTLLLKGFTDKGLIFYTNYQSRKAHEIAANPNATALFFWKELDRQVCIEGVVKKVSVEESMTYYARRPRNSQVSAWASQQGQKITSREVLDAEYARLDEFYGENAIPLPPHWGGFRLIPKRFEFWQGQEKRLHDRFQYTLLEGKWQIDRLSP